LLVEHAWRCIADSVRPFVAASVSHQLVELL